MIRNGNEIENGSTVTAKVCIVGSGPAGITAAWYLQKAGIQVTLLEGSRDVGTGPNYNQLNWPDKTLLYNGVATGVFAENEPAFLILPNDAQESPSERERSFGGTSTHWGGQSRPLDAVAMQGRGPAYPSWPISRADLEPYYQVAADFCNLYSGDFSTEFWEGVLGSNAPQLEGFDSTVYQFIAGQYLNFATRTMPDGHTIGESNADVILNASLVGINWADGRVNSVTVSSMDGSNPPQPANTFTVEADVFIMAMGAVANAQQLLLAGIPNDNIGRYFMCHPLIQNYIDGRGDAVVVSQPYLSQEETHFMNGQQTNGQPWKSPVGVGMTGRFSPSAEMQQQYQMGSCWFWGAMDMGMYFEQAPNPDSRVTLSDTLDPVFGQREAAINWAFNAADENTYNTAVRLFTEAVQQKSPGAQVTAQDWSTIASRAVVNGHHLGTCRMSDSAADGVVDANLRSHDLENLYVAGSAVWRTAAIPNPTFSIITFATRLADHLIPQLQEGLSVLPNGNYRIRGRVRNAPKGARVEAWDSDFLPTDAILDLNKDDLLGSAMVDALGHFMIEFSPSQFRELFVDRHPDVYFRVYGADGTLLRRSGVVRNARAGLAYFEV